MTMEILKLKDLVRTGQTEVALQEQYDYPDLPLTGPVAVQAHITLKDTGVLINGRFKAEVDEPCDRCYEPFVRELQKSFEDRFVYESLTDLGFSGEKELQKEDFYDTIGPAGILDVKDLIYQHIVLGLTENRFCQRDNCDVQIADD